LVVEIVQPSPVPEDADPPDGTDVVDAMTAGSLVADVVTDDVDVDDSDAVFDGDESEHPARNNAAVARPASR
jgi:hypothetical protein